MKKTLKIDARAYWKIMTWADIADGEVSMLGTVDVVNGEPVITDVFLVKQTCSSISTDMDQEDMGRLMVELERKESGLSSKLRAWIHSHARMDVFWSSTDQSTIDGLANDSFVVSVVVNKKGDALARIDIYKPLRLTVDGLTLLPWSTEDTEPLRKEFEEKVSEQKATPLSLASSLNRLGHVWADDGIALKRRRSRGHFTSLSYGDFGFPDEDPMAQPELEGIECDERI